MMATGMIQAKLLTPLSVGRGQSADIIHVERQHLHTILPRKNKCSGVNTCCFTKLVM